MRLMISILTALAFSGGQVLAAPCNGNCHEFNQPHKVEAQSSHAESHDCCDEAETEKSESPCHPEGSACLSQCALSAKVELQTLTSPNEWGEKFNGDSIQSKTTPDQIALDVNRSLLIARVHYDQPTSGVPFYIFYHKLLIP